MVVFKIAFDAFEIENLNTDVDGENELDLELMYFQSLDKEAEHSIVYLNDTFANHQLKDKVNNGKKLKYFKNKGVLICSIFLVAKNPSSPQNDCLIDCGKHPRHSD